MKIKLPFVTISIKTGSKKELISLVSEINKSLKTVEKELQRLEDNKQDA